MQVDNLTRSKYVDAAAGNVTLQLNTQAFEGQLVVTDITGKNVYHESVNGQTFNIDVSDFPTGLYLVSLQTNSGQTRYTKRLQVIE
jgi:hypothetical protein